MRVAIVLSLVVVACGTPDTPDAGRSVDAGVNDAGAAERDVGGSDAGAWDAGSSCPAAGCVPPEWVGSPFTASGTCAGSALLHSACAMGCCTTTGDLSVLDATLEFELLPFADELYLHVTKIDVSGDVQTFDATSEPSPTGRFRIDPFFMRVDAVSLTGRLSTRADAAGLTLEMTGSGLGGGGLCGQTEVTRACEWLLPAP